MDSFFASKTYRTNAHRVIDRPFYIHECVFLRIMKKYFAGNRLARAAFCFTAGFYVRYSLTFYVEGISVMDHLRNEMRIFFLSRNTSKFAIFLLVFVY